MYIYIYNFLFYCQGLIHNSQFIVTNSVCICEFLGERTLLYIRHQSISLLFFKKSLHSSVIKYVWTIFEELGTGMTFIGYYLVGNESHMISVN